MTLISTVEDAWVLRNSRPAAVRSASTTLLESAGADLRAAALAKVVLCYLDYREQRYERATTVGLEALAVLEANPTDPWLPRLYNNLGIIHFDLGERDTSRTYLDQQIRLSHELGDHTCEAMGYHDLGLLQAAIERHRGLATLDHARAMFHANADVEHEAMALYNMANIHHHAAEQAQAASYAAQAIALLRGSGLEGIGTRLIVYIATYMAEAATALGHHGEAQELLDEARGIALERFPELLSHVQFCQGLHLVATDDIEGALVQFQQALDHVAIAGQYELIADCQAALADCYERIGNYRAALHHYRAYAATHERTFRETSEQKVRALDVIHRVEIARQATEAERQRNTELQHHIQQLEQLHVVLREISVRDPLTSLYNRRYLAEEGERLVRFAQRYGTDLCAAMIDIDTFKGINDRLGHQIGDRVLQQVAHLLSQTVRGTDLIARYGGEEIALLLPATGIGHACIICERLRTAVEQYDWSSIHSDLQVTISIGLVEATTSTLTELFARADAQLYRSKQAGRNRISYDSDRQDSFTGS